MRRDSRCTGIVCYNYQMPTAQAPLTQLETMFGQSFTDLKSLADQEFTCTTTVTLPTGGSSNYGCNLSGVSLGTAAAPQVVYINGTGNSQPRHPGDRRRHPGFGVRHPRSSTATPTSSAASTGAG